MDKDQERRLVAAAGEDRQAFGSLTDAEEATSETLYKALRAIGRFRPRGSVQVLLLEKRG